MFCQFVWYSLWLPAALPYKSLSLSNSIEIYRGFAIFLLRNL